MVFPDYAMAAGWYKFFHARASLLEAFVSQSLVCDFVRVPLAAFLEQYSVVYDAARCTLHAAQHARSEYS